MVLFLARSGLGALTPRPISVGEPEMDISRVGYVRTSKQAVVSDLRVCVSFSVPCP